MQDVVNSSEAGPACLSKQFRCVTSAQQYALGHYCKESTSFASEPRNGSLASMEMAGVHQAPNELRQFPLQRMELPVRQNNSRQISRIVCKAKQQQAGFTF
eukprot:1152273-Pelagomonas_calceolata.AAC.6